MNTLYTLRTCGNVDEHKLAVVTVLVPIHARHNDDDGLSIRRNLRAGNVDDFLQVVQLYLSRLRPYATRCSEGKEHSQDSKKCTSRE